MNTAPLRNILLKKLTFYLLHIGTSLKNGFFQEKYAYAPSKNGFSKKKCDIAGPYNRFISSFQNLVHHR